MAGIQELVLKITDETDRDRLPQIIADPKRIQEEINQIFGNITDQPYSRIPEGKRPFTTITRLDDTWRFGVFADGTIRYVCSSPHDYDSAMKEYFPNTTARPIKVFKSNFFPYNGGYTNFEEVEGQLSQMLPPDLSSDQMTVDDLIIDWEGSDKYRRVLSMFTAPTKWEGVVLRAPAVVDKELIHARTGNGNLGCELYFLTPDQEFVNGKIREKTPGS